MKSSEKEAGSSQTFRLVIGYGNELRGDDAVGLVVVRAVEALGLPRVRVMACHQLTPELAEPIARADLVVFVDAAFREGENAGEEASLKVLPLSPLPTMAAWGHQSDPGSLLGLALALYDRHPPGWWVTIPATSMEPGQPLSRSASQGAERAVAAICGLLKHGPRAD